MDEALEALRRGFGYAELRPGQAEVLEAVLAGRDVVAVLATGAGKSLCFQMPALLRPGVTVVVSPLVALMRDQVRALVARGVETTWLDAGLDQGELRSRLAAVAGGRVRLVYVAPERLADPRFASALEQATVNLVAVDEAHCVSMWGHDFRPHYRRIAPALAALRWPQVLAVTATATPAVCADLELQLGLGQAPRGAPARVIGALERPGLALSVTRVAGPAEKLRRLRSLLPTAGAALVYAGTRRKVEGVAAALRALGVPAAGYHAGLPADERRAVEAGFAARRLDVVVATNAFGMGIDRADVRAVVHWDAPGSLEAYWQEVGRAGRDAAPARGELLFHGADLRLHELFIESGHPGADVLAAVVRALDAGRGAWCDGGSLVAGLGAEVNAAAAGRAVALLVEAGALEARRGERGPEVRRASGGALDVGGVASTEKALAARAWERLRALTAWLEAPGCRQEGALRYLGAAPASPCGICDRCRAAAAPPVAPEAVRARVERALLASVAALGGRVGRGRLLDVLAGDHAAAAGLPCGAHLGALAGEDRELVRGVLASLGERGLVLTVPGERPTVRLG